MDEEDTRKVMLKCEITRDQAIKTVKRWWLSPIVAWGLKRDGFITDSKVKYVPFWIVKAHVSGTVEGEAKEADTDGIYTVHIKRSINTHMIWNEIACDPEGIGVQYLWNNTGETRPYDAYTSHGVEPTISKKIATALAIKAIKDKAIELCGKPDKIESETLVIVPQKMGLIMYPLWIIGNFYEGKTYSVTIDGVTGDILAGRAPANRMIKRISPPLGWLTAILAVGLFLYGCFNQNEFCWSWLLALICPFIAYEAFNYGYYGDIVKGHTEDGYKPFRFYQEHSQVVEISDIK